jgi:hypothetical protein
MDIPDIIYDLPPEDTYNKLLLVSLLPNTKIDNYPFIQNSFQYINDDKVNDFIIRNINANNFNISNVPDATARKIINIKIREELKNSDIYDLSDKIDAYGRVLINNITNPESYAATYLLKSVLSLSSNFEYAINHFLDIRYYMAIGNSREYLRKLFTHFINSLDNKTAISMLEAMKTTYIKIFVFSSEEISYWIEELKNFPND